LSLGALKVGDVVTIEGSPAKDGSPVAFAYSIRAGGQLFDLSKSSTRTR
jgi:hypothetical protein